MVPEIALASTLPAFELVYCRKLRPRDLAVALVACQHPPAFAVFRDACVAEYRSARMLADDDVALRPCSC